MHSDRLSAGALARPPGGGSRRGDRTVPRGIWALAAVSAAAVFVWRDGLSVAGENGGLENAQLVVLALAASVAVRQMWRGVRRHGLGLAAVEVSAGLLLLVVALAGMGREVGFGRELALGPDVVVGVKVATGALVSLLAGASSMMAIEGLRRLGVFLSARALFRPGVCLCAAACWLLIARGFEVGYLALPISEVLEEACELMAYALIVGAAYGLPVVTTAGGAPRTARLVWPAPPFGLS